MAKERTADWASLIRMTGWCRRAWTRSASAAVATVAAGFSHSAALTEGGCPLDSYDADSQVPGGLGHADLRDRLVPTLVSGGGTGWRRSFTSAAADGSRTSYEALVMGLASCCGRHVAPNRCTKIA